MINEINMDAVTIQDCIDLYMMKGVTVLVEDGEIKDFLGEND